MEIKNIVSLSHPGILTIVEVFEGNLNFYIIMEYLEGNSLDHHIKKGDLSFKSIMVILKVSNCN